MRILRVADIPDNRTGGMSRTMYLTGDEMVRLGHSVDYAFTNDLKAPGSAKLRRFTVPLALPRIVRERSIEKPYDLVEIHEPLAAAYAWRRRKEPSLPPMAIFSYGLEERGYGAEVAYRRLKSQPIPLKFHVSPHTRLLQSKYAVRHADHVVCSNQEDIDYLAERGVPRQSMTRHFSGVTDDLLRRTAELVEMNRRGVLFIGNWIDRKGVIEVTRAVTDLLVADSTATFTAAGVGIDPQQVLVGFPVTLHGRIRVLRSINDAELVRLLAEHSVFLLPSYYEGQPLVMIEAAAGGLAIITTSICGMRDFIRDGESGRFVEVGNGAQVSQVLQELWAQPELCRALGRAARATAEKHTWAASAENLLVAYQRTVAAAR